MNKDFNKKDKKRYSSVFICIALIVISFFVFLIYFNNPSIKKQVQEFGKEHSFLNPSIALFDKNDLIVNFQSLRDSLTKKYETNEDYLISIYFEYLSTGANISINKDEKIWPASLIKIPISMAVMKKVESGEWKLSNELVILDEDKDNEYGTFYLKPTGTTVSIENLLKETLQRSDNTTYFVLLRNLEAENIEEVYNHLGLDDIISSLKSAPAGEEEDNRITAKRYTIFFRSLYNSTFLIPKYSQLFLDILKEAPCEYLCKGIPSEIDFVHKSGIRTDKAVYADSGIVYVPGRPYLITTMIQRRDGDITKNKEIDKIFENISKEIYDYVNQVK